MRRFSALCLCFLALASFSYAADYAGSLNVYVKDSQGNPVAGAKVYAGDASTFAPKFTESVTNGKGKATIRGLQPRTYVVQVEHRDYEKDLGSFRKANVTTNGAAKVYINIQKTGEGQQKSGPPSNKPPI